MNLKETIAYLEEYYSYTSELFYSDEANELRGRVEHAFRFTEDELEKALSTHPEYAFVRFSSLEYYMYDIDSDNFTTVRKNEYKSAIIPRMIADIFSEYFQKATLYKFWWQLEEDARKQGVGSRTSYKLELINDLLHKTENKGYGYIVSEITQQKNYTMVVGEEYEELGNSYSWKKSLGSFVKDEEDNLKFKILLPELEDVFMELASEKLEILERKRVKTEG